MQNLFPKIVLGVLLLLQGVGLTVARAQSTNWDAMLENSQWYVPSENLLAYITPGTNLTSTLPFADQTTWDITNSVHGIFNGLTALTGTIGTNVITQSSNTILDGVITDSGQVRMRFTATNGAVTTGIGQERTINGTNTVEMQMITGSGGASGTYITHWAYMLPYTNGVVPPTTLPTNPVLLSTNWNWMQGTTWNLQNQDLFGTNTSGLFSVSNYLNGYFWGSGTGPAGGSIGDFTLIGSATPEGNILFNVLDSSNDVLTSLTGMISGEGESGVMGLRTYTFETNGSYAGSASVIAVPEPGITSLLGLGGLTLLMACRRSSPG
jgi:hypothetical protein